MWEPPSREKMATIYDDRDKLREQVATLTRENSELREQLAPAPRRPDGNFARPNDTPYGPLADKLRAMDPVADCDCFVLAVQVVDSVDEQYRAAHDKGICQSCGESYYHVPTYESSEHCFACFTAGVDAAGAEVRAELVALEKQLREVRYDHQTNEAESETLDVRLTAARKQVGQLIADVQKQGRRNTILTEALRRYSSDENWIGQKQIAVDALSAAAMEET